MSQEKTEQASPKKLKDAREKGEIPRSKELPVVLTLIFAFAHLLFFGDTIIVALKTIFHTSFTFELGELDVAADAFGGKIQAAAITILGALAVFLCCTIVIAFAGNGAVGGFIFATKKLKPDFSKLNPVEGIKRMFSMKQVVELVKSILKSLLILIPLGMMIEEKLFGFSAIKRTHSPTAVFETITTDVISGGLLFASLLLLVVAIDVPYQIYHFNKQNMMTKQEVKEEYKNTEGNPEIKAKRRRLQMEMSRKASRNRVQEADIIITNPTHYAVGLKFEMGVMEAPRVVALGADNIALAIRAKAAEMQIPVLEIPPLARVLYKTTEVGQDIPITLFQPVATVVAYIYQLNDRLAFQITDDFINSLEIDESKY
ncbi:flagellar biosynthesis protein FlhB [Vibrio crassostreae]|uniref:flagellar biosynthesis protein FlhB n=1 Tax=Vibrio crassostreae TaxID=246167 RepID=UPI001B30D3A6|nr:flagellar biosynthesis protein FlhB [Vibrio crassostreae]